MVLYSSYNHQILHDTLEIAQAEFQNCFQLEPTGLYKNCTNAFTLQCYWLQNARSTTYVFKYKLRFLYGISATIEALCLQSKLLVSIDICF